MSNPVRGTYLTVDEGVRLWSIPIPLDQADVKLARKQFNAKWRARAKALREALSRR